VSTGGRYAGVPTNRDILDSGVTSATVVTPTSVNDSTAGRQVTSAFSGSAVSAEPELLSSVMVTADESSQPHDSAGPGTFASVR
jgi:hypothetical protein